MSRSDCFESLLFGTSFLLCVYFYSKIIPQLCILLLHFTSLYLIIQQIIYRVARLLGSYQSKIENAMIALNETETRLNFVKGQGHSKLQSATLRRDDAKHRRDLLLKAIQSNTAKGRSIAEEISKIRAEISMNEQDLMAAQQMESQTKLRVETIEHEMSMERARHADAVVSFETKANEMDEAKVKIAQSMEEKKAMIETKKAELKKIWEKCTELRKSEGHDGKYYIRYKYIISHISHLAYTLLISSVILLSSTIP